LRSGEEKRFFNVKNSSESGKKTRQEEKRWQTYCIKKTVGRKRVGHLYRREELFVLRGAKGLFGRKVDPAPTLEKRSGRT